MGRIAVNVVTPAEKQVWEHVKTGQQLAVLQIVGDTALCAALDMEAAGDWLTRPFTKLRVAVPVDKLKFLGNRGMAYLGVRKGKFPKPGSLDETAWYNTRAKNLGAL
jgi:hypothetical protein